MGQVFDYATIGAQKMLAPKLRRPATGNRWGDCWCDRWDYLECGTKGHQEMYKNKRPTQRSRHFLKKKVWNTSSWLVRFGENTVRFVENPCDL